MITPLLGVGTCRAHACPFEDMPRDLRRHAWMACLSLRVPRILVLNDGDTATRPYAQGSIACASGTIVTYT